MVKKYIPLDPWSEMTYDELIQFYIILNLLANEPRRMYFSKLQKRSSMPRKTLSRRLEYLVDLGLVERMFLSGNKVFYKLTAEGQSKLFLLRLEVMDQVGKKLKKLK